MHLIALISRRFSHSVIRVYVAVLILFINPRSHLSFHPHCLGSLYRPLSVKTQVSAIGRSKDVYDYVDSGSWTDRHIEPTKLIYKKYI